MALALPGLDTVWKTFVFLITLSVLVVLHEYGHFLMARRNGVQVNDFAVGFGPTLFKWTSPRSGTNYRINALPIGGYCAMQGEDGKTSEAEQQREFRVSGNHSDDNFQAKSTWQRLVIIVAGPVANFLVAFVLLFTLAVTFGIETADSKALLTMGPVQPDTPAARAGLTMGDTIVAIDGVHYTDGTSMVKKIHASLGKPLRLTYRRHGADTTITIVPEKHVQGKETYGAIGFSPMFTLHRVGPVEGAQVAVLSIWQTIDGTLQALTALVVHPADGIKNLSGPIGMGRAANQIIEQGPELYLLLAARISIALGIFNLLPIPALDGGRALFIVVEMLRGKPVDPEREALVHVAGFAALMVLMLFVAFHDIANIVHGRGVL